MTERTLTEIHAELLKARMESISARLRKMADDVDRVTTRIDRVPSPGSATFIGIAAEVQHDVLWGLANLNLGGLTSMAGDADTDRMREASTP